MLNFFIIQYILAFISLILYYKNSSVAENYDNDGSFGIQFVPILGIWIAIYSFLFIFSSYAQIKQTNNDSVPLSFKQFEDYFTLNPDRWELEDVKNFNYTKYLDRNYYGKRKIDISFVTKKDYKKAVKLFNSYQSEKKIAQIKKRQSESYKELLEEVQKDIDKINEQSQEEIKGAVEIAKKVQNNLKQENL